MEELDDKQNKAYEEFTKQRKILKSQAMELYEKHCKLVREIEDLEIDISTFLDNNTDFIKIIPRVRWLRYTYLAEKYYLGK